MRTLAIDIPLDQIRAFCARHPIRKTSLFGSVVRDDFTPDSDVDFLVELDPDAPVGLFKFIGMKLELDTILNREADLRTPKEFRPASLRKIFEEAEVLYVKDA